MIHYSVLVLCLAYFLGGGIKVQASDLIDAFHLEGKGDVSHVLLRQRHPGEIKPYHLRHPNRIVLDIPGSVSSRLMRDMPAALVRELSCIKVARFGRHDRGMTRLVLEMAAAHAYKTKSVKRKGERWFALLLDACGHGTQVRVDPLQAASSTGSDGEEGASGTRVSSTPSSGRRERLTIVIDPGHGGVDPGAIGADGTQEKDVNLAVAKRIKALLDQQSGMQAILTRDSDVFIPLHERVAIARKHRAALLLSIHADAFSNRTARGSSVYALSERGATSVAARWLAREQNQVDQLAGIDVNVSDPYLKETLVDLVQTATVRESLSLGRFVLAQLGELHPPHRDRVEQAGFAVLKAPDIPSILIETAFLSNPTEERRLRQPEFQNALASAIVSGVRAFLLRDRSLGNPLAAVT